MIVDIYIFLICFYLGLNGSDNKYIKVEDILVNGEIVVLNDVINESCVFYLF